jgi:hypothetical protein
MTGFAHEATEVKELHDLSFHARISGVPVRWEVLSFAGGLETSIENLYS